MDGLISRLKSDGFEVVSGPRFTGDGYYESCIVGMEGNLIEITEGMDMRDDITRKMEWTREPKRYSIRPERIEITTEPHTDLWQRTYYHFRNDNAPVLQMETERKYFSFVVRTDFSGSHHRFDQCGIVMYLDSENWLKASVEYENEKYQHLGSVVTNHGYSDWATTEIPADVKVMWYRFSRRGDDYCVECSLDGEKYSQMRICHMWEGAGAIRFGIYACSPEDSSFQAVFSHMEMQECAWKAHDGQQPDEAQPETGQQGEVGSGTGQLFL